MTRRTSTHCEAEHCVPAFLNLANATPVSRGERGEGCKYQVCGETKKMQFYTSLRDCTSNWDNGRSARRTSIYESRIVDFECQWSAQVLNIFIMLRCFSSFPVIMENVTLLPFFSSGMFSRGSTFIVT